MGKRRRSKDLEKRLEKLEKLLCKRRRYSVSTCDESSGSQSRSRSPPHRSRPSRARRQRKSRRNPSPSPSPSPSCSSASSVEEVEADNVAEPDIVPTGTVGESSLPANIEGLLGLEGAPSVSNGIELHESLKQRWMAILQNGLEEDIKLSLIKKYDPPSNCSLLLPPKLNAEVAAAMNESGIKRDKRITDQQAVLASAISAIGKVLNNLISSENTTEIETLSDSARLLCGLYQANTETRKSLILPGLNKDLKETLSGSTVSEFLFGDKLQDKISACKAVQKSAQDLKNTPALKNKTKKTLNFRGPQRPHLPRPSGQKPHKPRQMMSMKQTTSRLRRSPARQHLPRRQDHRRR